MHPCWMWITTGMGLGALGAMIIMICYNMLRDRTR